MKYKIKITSKCSRNEMYDNFNYSILTNSRNSLEVLEEGYLIRDRPNIKYLKTYEDSETAIKILKNNENYSIFHTLPQIKSVNQNEHLLKSLSDRPWIVVNHTFFLNGNGLLLKEGDIVRSGREVFQILEIRTDNQINESIILNSEDSMKNRDENINHQEDLSPEAKTKNAKYICKFCYCPEELNNMLLNICKCTGSMKFIHFNCLKKWIGNKISIKKDKVFTSYRFRNFECELCKSPLSEKIMINNKSVSLYNIEKTAKNYILMKLLSASCNQIYMISFDTTTNVSIGRTYDPNFPEDDQNQNSRVNCFIKFKEGDFYIEDNNSKLGTLVLMQNPISLIKGKTLSIQLGNHFLSFNLEKKNCLYFDLCTGKKTRNQIPCYNEIIKTMVNPEIIELENNVHKEDEFKSQETSQDVSLTDRREMITHEFEEKKLSSDDNNEKSSLTIQKRIEVKKNSIINKIFNKNILFSKISPKKLAGKVHKNQIKHKFRRKIEEGNNNYTELEKKVVDRFDGYDIKGSKTLSYEIERKSCN